MKNFFLIIIFTNLIFYSCKDTEEKNKCNTNNLKIYRLEKALFNDDPFFINNRLEEINSTCKNCLEIFSNDIIKIGKPSDSLYTELLQSFVSNYYNYQLYKRVVKIYDNIQWLENELGKAFCKVVIHFPEATPLKIYTFISGFNQKVLIKDSTIGIGLEYYLGKNERLYDEYGFYNYLKVNMHRKKIVPDVVYNYGKYLFPYNDSINNLVTNMIYEGMLIYFVKSILPSYHDTIVFGFTLPQLNFCLKNEKNMWTYLIENKLLFNNNPTTISRFIKEGPYTQDFGRNSPARAVIWIGYKIVSSYAKKNNTDLSKLMKNRNYMRILNDSKYKP